MKTTEERIEEIIEEFTASSDKFYDFDKQILRLELENLVTQAKLEQLKEKL
jgi:hypothetical protein